MNPYDHGGKQSLQGVGGRSSGYRQPRYSGADQARGSSKATKSKQAAPYNKGTAGGAKAGNGPKNRKPGQGPMGQGAARGSDSYPTKNSAKRHDSGHKNTLKSSSYR